MNDDLDEKLKEIDEVISNVPDEVLSAMKEIGFDEKLRLISFDNKLNVEESGQFHDLVEGYILGGYEDEEFNEKLSVIVKNREILSKIGIELNEKILLPLRNQLINEGIDSIERNVDLNANLEEEGEEKEINLDIKQNKAPEAPSSIIGNNLSSPSINISKNNNYSLPKMGESIKSIDPYLEPINEKKSE